MELETDRLLLNSFDESEAPLVAELAGDKRVAEMTAEIPYPYETSMAVSWIRDHQREREENHNYIFAIRLKETKEFIGGTNIGLNKKHDSGYIGYWIAHSHWGKGYCTEAVKRIIHFGFEEKKLNKIWAEYKAMNTASGRVLEKVGMKYEGTKRSHYRKGENDYLDMSIKSILREEWRQGSRSPDTWQHLRFRGKRY